MKDNFDDLLKRKWEEQHFPVDEQHRADMIALLDGQKRRKVFPFWWISGLGLAALVAGYFLVARHDAPSAAMHQSNDSINVDANQNTQLQPGSKGTSEAISNAAGSALNTASNTKAEAVPVTTTPGSADKNNPSGNLNETAPGQKNNTNNKPSSSSNKSTDKQSQQQTKPEVKPVIPITLSDKPASGEIIEKGVSPDGTFRVDEQAARSYQIISNAVAVTIEDPEADITPYIPPKPGSRIRVNVDEIDLLELSGIHYTSDQAPGRITPKTSFNHTVYVFGEAGAGMILASKPDYNTGWKLRAGGGLGFTLSPKVQVTWAAGYLLQAGGFDFQRTSTVSQAGFGTRSSFNSLTPDKLHFVYTRLGAQYRLHRNVFAAHGGIQYLYGAQGDIVVQTHDQFVAGVTETSTYDWVKTDGLRKLHWTADLSYGYQLTPRLMASAGTDIYFSSITVADDALAQEGYYWNGAYAALHPFITLNYILYGSK